MIVAVANAPPACPNDETIDLLLQVKTLKSLMLTESRFDYASLIRLRQLPELKQLTLDGIDVSDADYAGLKQELSDVRVALTKPSEVYLKRINSLFGK